MLNATAEPLLQRPIFTRKSLAGFTRKLTEGLRCWREYHSGAFCVFGHYSTYRGEQRSSKDAFCADYAVAKRWQERKAGQQDNFRGLLGALRFPESVVVFDSGARDNIL